MLKKQPSAIRVIGSFESIIPVYLQLKEFCPIFDEKYIQESNLPIFDLLSYDPVG
jgi:hypothetical protein